MKRRFLMALALLAAVSGGAAFAQGVQTATLTGTVTDADGAVLAGVTVTANSPVSIGEKSTTTNEQGEYILRGLTPGQYTVRFERESMQTVELSTAAQLGTVTNL